jgi:hypothetical protein
VTVTDYRLLGLNDSLAHVFPVTPPCFILGHAGVIKRVRVTGTVLWIASEPSEWTWQEVLRLQWFLCWATREFSDQATLLE